MVKRTPWKMYVYLAFALMILLVTWEHNRMLAAVVETDIPEESIRLRILANSDSVMDQALKRHVRDAIVDQMNSWVTGPTTLEEARMLVQERLHVLEEVVATEIARYGYDYTFHVELGKVPFPAKLYGNKVYPAGDYEALRVTIGAGEGQNWWCVLFPPLCFIDTAKGEAVESAKAEGGDTTKVEAAKSKSAKGKAEVQGNKGELKVKEAGKQELKALDEGEEQPKKKVRFFLWEKIKGWFA